MLYNKEMKSASAALGPLRKKSIGLADSNSSKDLEARKSEKEALKLKRALTQEMLMTATKA